MKLAEALLARSELQQKLGNIQIRITNNSKFQEGDKPQEDPNELLKEYSAVNDELTRLVKRINKRNSEITLEDGRTLSEALVDREALMKERQLLVNVTRGVSGPAFRLMRSEIKMCAAVEVTQLQKKIDELSKQYRELDTLIQAKNWTVDL